MKNILFVGAHFDDIELGCGGTVTRFKDEGRRVIGLVLTNSAYTNFSGKVYRTEKMALREGRAAAKILGIEMEYGGYETKKLEFEEELVEYINKIIYKHSIDTVFCHWINDVTHDHVAAARAAITAARHVPNILMFQSNWYLGPEPFRANFFVDVTNHIDTKIRAIKEHKIEVSRRGERWLEFFLGQNRSAGKMVGVEYAESFQLVSMKI